MKLLLIPALLLLSIAAGAQNPTVTNNTKKFIKEVSRIVERTSLFSDSLNWQKIPDDVNSLPFTGNDSNDHVLILKYFIKCLRNAGDKHSFFFRNHLSIRLLIDRQIILNRKPAI